MEKTGNNVMKYSIHQIAIIGTTALLLGGCAATGDMDKMKADIATAQSTADSAKTMATQALDTANKAMQMAEQANSNSEDAKSMAQNAMNAAKAASEKADQMYKKSVSK
jgi:murein lipoprotein